MPEPRRPEQRDVNVRLVSYFAAGLAVLIVAVLIALRLLFGVVANPLPFGEVAERVPQPTLQIDPAADLRRHRAAEERMLTSYGWVDRSAGIAHIPIGRAMALLAEQGVPNWGQAAAGSADSDCALLTAAVPRTPQAAICRQGTADGGRLR